MLRPIARVSICAYTALLILGAWPFYSVPVLGAVSYVSSELLRKIAVLPGMAVFAGISSSYGTVSDCIRISGREAGGAWQLLHRTECPPNASWHSSVDQALVHHLFAVGGLSRVLIDWDELPARPPEALRRLAVLGDLACHSPRFGAEPRAEARVESLQRKRSVVDGAEAIAELRCDFACSPTELAPPRCGGSPRPSPAAGP